MRISTPKTDDNDLMAGPGDVYAPEISAAGNAFARAIYLHSGLPLRVFEACLLYTSPSPRD